MVNLIPRERRKDELHREG